MSVLWFDGLLAQVADAGVYFLPEDDIEELLEAAAINRFPCLRVNLRRCRDKADLLLRIAGVLEFAPHVAQDWSVLAEALAAMRRPELSGQVLLLEHSEDLREQARGDFKAAMQALQAASADWATRGLPLWTFIVLGDAEFDALG